MRGFKTKMVRENGFSRGGGSVLVVHIECIKSRVAMATLHGPVF